MSNASQGLRIGELARRAALSPSAIRYYEHAGILPPPPRVGGKRLYDPMALNCLRLIVAARQAGLTMAEIRQLASRFAPGTPPSVRWRTLGEMMMAEAERLTARADHLRAAARRTLRCEGSGRPDCLTSFSSLAGEEPPRAERRAPPQRAEAHRSTSAA